MRYSENSWLITKVDDTEFGPVYPIQLKILKYENHEDWGVLVATMAIMKDFVLNHCELRVSWFQLPVK